MDILTGTPESQGVCSEAVLAFVDALEARELQIISLVLLRGGQKIAQLCKTPYEQDGLRLLFSLSKSFTGIGVGIAIDQGLLSLDDAVISFFPDKLPEPISDNLRAMTVRHLLTMSCGNHDDIYPLVYPERDWVRAFLAQRFPCAPGSFYRYNTHASYMLSAIAERVTGGSFYAFVKEHLLGPLDIAESSWEICRQGVTAGGMGLGLSTESVARFGQMLLGGGVYGGRRIVSQRYVALATSAQIDKGSQEKPSRSEAYGFQIHIDREGCFYGDGSFGQLCYVSPRHGVVLALNSQKSPMDTDAVIELLWEKVLNPIEDKASSPGAAPGRLCQREMSLSCPLPEQRPLPPGMAPPRGVYRFGDNPGGLRSAAFSRGRAGEWVMRLGYRDGEDSEIGVFFDRPARGFDVFVKDIQRHRQPYVAYGSWEGDHFRLTVFYTETPYVVTYKLAFCGEELKLDFDINLSLSLQNFGCTGRREREM